VSHKSKYYELVIFPPEIIREAYGRFLERLPEGEELWSEHYHISTESEDWDSTSLDEFFGDYRKGFWNAGLRIQHQGQCMFTVDACTQGFIQLARPRPGTLVGVHHTSKGNVDYILEVFDSNCNRYAIQKAEQIKVFIGHGRSLLWRDLKDHLQDLHGLKVIAYESGARAGMSIQEVLGEMLTGSSFALLVLTSEDLDADGRFHARENVIHELGLFQGKLGFKKAIVLLEQGVAEFSNIHGLNQIRFSKGNIKETFGDVLATIRREFGQNSD